MTPPRRARCVRCLRAASACICRWIAPPLAHATSVLILQHPLEVANAKGSARLLHLGLPGSVMLTGESFDPARLETVLAEGGRMPVLLYPETPGLAAPPMPPLPPAAMRLVVLDGTWRKSRKMLHLNALLQALPRLALRAMPASHYRIRKAHAPDQLSTLEAACYALQQIEDAKVQPILDGFDGFVAQQAAYARGLK
ncbi:MAG: tRNA-uridine aminocarboxypropyltransferase [Pseudomonadota bacterium]